MSGLLRVAPAYEEVVIGDRVDEGKTVLISYTNDTTAPVTLQIFPIDFKQADGSGAVSFLGQQSGSFSYSLSSFLSFESDRIELSPGEKQIVTVRIKNREDLSPGGHYAAVVARVVTEAPGKQATLVSPSLSALILLRKTGGERFNLSLADVDWPKKSLVIAHPKQINLTFKNEGNIHVVPYGRVEIRDILHRLVYKGVVNTASLRVFPESRRYISVDLDRTEPLFPVSVETLSIAGQDSLQKTTYHYNENYLYINPLFLLVIGFIIVGVFKWKKSKRT